MAGFLPTLWLVCKNMTLPMTGAGPSGAGGGLAYLLRAPFTGDDQGYANAQVLDTVAEGITAGSLTVAESAGTLALVSNKCAYTGGGGWFVTFLISQAIDRALGRTLLATISKSATNTFAPVLLWNSDASFADFTELQGFGAYFPNSANLQAMNRAGLVPTIGAYAAATDYQVALVLGGYTASGIPWYTGQTPTDYLYGQTAFIKGGAYTTWTRLFQVILHNDDPIYAVVTSYNATGTFDSIRVPDVSLSTLLQPTHLSTFDAANGTSLDAITPEIGTGWTEDTGNWDIQGNKANVVSLVGSVARATVDSGLSDCVIHCTVRMTGAATDMALMFRYTDTSNYWYLVASYSVNTISIQELQGGVWAQRAFSVYTINRDTDYQLLITLSGNDIRVCIDGAVATTYTSSFNAAATKHGLWAYNVVGYTFDNFAVYPRTSAVYDAALDAV